ncbi:MAG TPA: hypothetical protein VJ547_13000 [Candidatus Thermoplasmatota archaeon]|nr:hypothetical protein [Candidatus Thermoplasmatota archaeon]
MVEVTEIEAPARAGGGADDLPEVARRTLEESSPGAARRPAKEPELPRVQTPSASAPGAHRVHILIAGGGRVRETVSNDLADVARAIEEAGTHEVWVDIEAEDAERALAPFDAKVTTEHYLVQNQDKRSVLGWPYLVRDLVAPRFCVLVAAGDTAVVTVHPPDVPHDPVADARKVMDSAVHARTDGGFKPLGSFREFVFLQIAESCVSEMMGAIQRQSKRLGQVYDNVYDKEFAPAAIQTALFDVHRYLEQSFSPTLFLDREFLFTLERGGARFLPLEGVKGDLARLADELDRLMGLKTNMETTIELVSNAVRAKLSEETLAASWRLQLAVEVLVRVSLLIMIPTAVFSLWPMMPFPVSEPFDLFGIRTYSVVWTIFTAMLLTVAAQLMLSRMYKRAYGLEGLRGASRLKVDKK